MSDDGDKFTRWAEQDARAARGEDRALQQWDEQRAERERQAEHQARSEERAREAEARSREAEQRAIEAERRSLQQIEETRQERARQAEYQARSEARALDAERRALQQWDEHTNERAFQREYQARSEARSIDAEKRSLEQIEETRQERARQHEFQERSEARAIDAEKRALDQWEEHRQERERQHEFQDRAEDRAKEAHGWHHEGHTITMRREEERLENERRARQLADERFSQTETSGVLGLARFGTIDDAKTLGAIGHSNAKRKLFLGVLDGRGLYYNGPSHLLTYAPNRAGKGRNVILQNLAHLDPMYDGHSVVVVDVKNGENAYSSAQHRAKHLHSKVVCLNPSGLAGLPTMRMNPLSYVWQGTRAEIFDKAATAAHVLVPTKAGDKDPWVKQGARLVLQSVIAHLANTDPEHCTLGNLWHFVVQSDRKIREFFKGMEQSTIPEVAGYAAQFGGLMVAQNQWAAYHAEMSDALAAFGPSSPFTEATNANEWDAATLTSEPCTVYLMMRGSDLESKGRWVSLMLNNMIETAAQRPGAYKPLFLLDEFTQLPPIPAVMKALNLYSGLGLKLWFFAQDRRSIAALYGDDGAARIEGQSEVLQAWSIRDPSLMKDIEYWAGKTTVPIINATVSDGAQMGTGISRNEHARPLIQPEDFRALAEDEQLIFFHRGPVFKAKLQPWDKTRYHQDVLNDPRDVLTEPKPVDITVPTAPRLKRLHSLGWRLKNEPDFFKVKRSFYQMINPPWVRRLFTVVEEDVPPSVPAEDQS